MSIFAQYSHFFIKMNKKRHQLTLFIEKNQSKKIEKIRRIYNPMQFGLIKSHITLCREDEIELSLQKIIQNLKELVFDEFIMNFGNTIRFEDEKGVLIPSIDDNEAFITLRKLVLKDIIQNPRIHQPHITLMHPRNSTCDAILFDQLQKIKLPHQFIFKKISLIEQENQNKWKILDEFQLNNIFSDATS